MKNQKAKSIKQKILVPIVTLIIFNLIVPLKSMASFDLGGFLISPFVGLFATIGDMANDLLYVSFAANKDNAAWSFLPDFYDNSYVKVNVKQKANDLNVLYSNGDNKPVEVTVDQEEFFSIGGYGIPNIRITPAEIFANKIAMLDANYFKSQEEYNSEAGGSDRAIAFKLKETIASWYNTLRMVSVVGLLSVLVYLAIRIMISSLEQKAKYKETLTDWVVALCLIFCLHYIMVFTMSTIDLLVNVINGAPDSTEFHPTQQVHVTITKGTLKESGDEEYKTVEEEMNEVEEEAKKDASEEELDENSKKIVECAEEVKTWVDENAKSNGTDSKLDADSKEELAAYTAFDDLFGIGKTFEDSTLLTDEEKSFLSYQFQNMPNKMGNLSRDYKLLLISKLTTENQIKFANEFKYFEDQFSDYTTNAEFVECYNKIYNEQVATTEITSNENNNEETVTEETKTEEGKAQEDEKGTLANGLSFYTNLTGLMRLCVEYAGFGPKVSSTIMYLALTMYTVYFTWIYLKRFLTLTFLTLIAPLVSLTYPIDKVKDGKAQAFSFWLKEYIANAMLPVIHSILYMVLVTSATDLVVSSPVYAMCSLAFIVPAEKLVKAMFGINSQTAPALGGFAGGAMASSLMQKRAGKGGKSSNESSGNKKIRTKKAEGIDSSFEDMIPGARGGATRTASSGGADSATGDGEPAGPTYDSRLSADQIDELKAEGIGPGDAEYSSALANYGIHGEPPEKASGSTTPSPEPVKKEESYEEKLEAMSKEKSIFKNDTNMNHGDKLAYIAKDGPIFKDSEKGKGKAEKAKKEHRAIKGMRNIGSNGMKMARRKLKLTKGKTGRQLVGRAAKFTAKAASRAALMSVGLAAGMVGGNMNDMWKGLAGGFVAGGMLGNKVGDKVTNLPNNVGDFFNELKNGEDAVTERRSQREFRNDEDNLSYVNEHYKDLPRSQRTEMLNKMSILKDSGASDDIEELDRLVQLQEEGVRKSGITKDDKEAYAKVQEQEMKKAAYTGKFSKDVEKKAFYNGDVEKIIKEQTKRFEKNGLSHDDADAAAREFLNNVGKVKGV